MTDPTKILIRMPNWLGDLMMATAFCQAVLKCFPEATVDLIIRKGFEGLCGLVMSRFESLLTSGSVFIFFNGRRDRVKLLCWEGDGFAIYYKRLERGSYELPVSAWGTRPLTASEVGLLLSGISLSSVRYRKRYSSKK